MRKTKVLHLLASSRFSGAENVVCQIIAMFKNDDFEMVYCSPMGPIKASLEEREINFLPLKNFSLTEIKRTIEKFDPDIVHAHDIKASIMAAIAGRKRRIISHVHVNNKMGKINLKSLLYGTFLSQFDHIYWVSESAYENFRFKDRALNKSTILYNVVDPDSIIKKAAIDPMRYDYEIVFVGRLTYQKDPERLIQVISTTIKSKPDIQAAIIGEGELKDETKRLVESLKMEDNIHFLGFLENPLQIVKDAKVMLMTSRFEGTPMCALEAMLLGVPIVSTPTDGLCTLIEDGVTGYLSDQDDVLSRSLLNIITDPRLQSFLSNNTEQKFHELNDVASYKKTIEASYHRTD